MPTHPRDLTCIDCKHPPPLDPDTDLPLIVSLPCFHVICHICWLALLRAIDDPAAPPDHSPFCHICLGPQRPASEEVPVTNAASRKSNNQDKQNTPHIPRVDNV